MDNINKIDSLHNQMPQVYATRSNKTWKGLIDAIGSNDQEVADLIESVRKQFFVKTASRPYIDRLAARDSVQRPRFVGMDDPTFREFIPIISYSPKQVKIVFDRLIDLFFFKESTTSYIQTTVPETYAISNDWTLEYIVDSYRLERISFTESDFVDINNVSANEIVGAINRQSKYSYAIPYENSVTKKTYVRIFTKTIGSKGSIGVTGGLANIGLKFDGFNDNAGNATDTAWQVTKIGDTTTLQYISGDDPGLEFVSAGDYVLSQLSGCYGSFTVTNVDAGNKNFTVTNLFAEDGLYTQTSARDLKFLKPHIAHVFKKDRRALVWEVNPREITVEVPPSPPVVKRSRRGAFHINGVESLIESATQDSLSLKDASRFADSGYFILQPTNEIDTKFGSNVKTFTYDTRFSHENVYKYSSKVGNTLSGITPSLPSFSSLNEFGLISGIKDNNIFTITTTTSHNFKIGEYATIEGADYLNWSSTLLYSFNEITKYNGVYYTSLIDNNNNQPDISSTWSVATFVENLNGTYLITDIPNLNTVCCKTYGTKSRIGGGTIRVERVGISLSSSKVIAKTSTLEPKRHGPYMWKTDADFVLSSNTAKLTSRIEAGVTSRNIAVTANTIPNKEGRIVFGFGTSKQEGPVRYFFKPSDQSIAIDPAYVFKYSHDAGTSVTSINKRGGIEFNGTGSEMPPYITDPSSAREILQELMQEVKSVGVFLNFQVRYPKQYYATVDVYRSGKTI